jgi:hypothetical protein
MKETVTNVQGDVIFKRIEMLPQGKRLPVPEDLRQGILAYGEVTGHRHQLMDSTAFDAFIILNKVYIQVNKEMLLQHGMGKELKGVAEHQSQVILPGVYQVDGAIETDWLTRTIRRVID